MEANIHKRDKKKRPKAKSKSISKRQTTRNKYTHQTRHGSFGCFVFCLINILSCAMVHLSFHHKLPTPLPESVESFAFSEERALIHLQALASFGVRTVGSLANEIKSPNYIIDYIQNINHSLHEKCDRTESQTLNQIEIDLQKVSGAFSLDFLGGFVNKYENITNILVRISNPNRPATLTNAILISAHYDTALGSAGVSDDGINIAIMMELVRNLLCTQKELNFAVIFNFNGGEESVLPAAHGFITTHQWSESIKMFINLEASGAGGAELLFQVSANHGWLVDVYKRGAMHPYGQSLGNVIFSSGVIPSLTDFAVYSKYGKRVLVGLDFAFADNGYVYHTAKDKADEVDIGSLQHCGDNVLSLVHTLNSDLVHNASYFYQYLHGEVPSHWVDRMYMNDNYVFYDFFGLAMIGYPYTIAIVAHVILFILFVHILIRNYWSKRHLLTYVFRIMVANTFGIIGSTAIGVFTFTFHRMRWYSHPSMAVLIFGAPCVMIIVYIHDRFHVRSTLDSTLSTIQMESYLITADALCWYIILMLITIFVVGISVLALFWCVSFLLILYLRILWFHTYKWRTYEYIYDLLHCALLMLPMMVVHMLSTKTLQVFIPLMGRSGDVAPADIIISVIIAFCVCMTATGAVPFMYRLKRQSRLWICVVLLIMTVLSLIINSTHSVYGVKTPKRLFIQSTMRAWANGSNDAGLWFNSMDSLALEPFKNLGMDMFDHMERYRTFRHHEHGWFLPIDDMLTKSLYVDVDYDELMHVVPQEYRTNVKIINQSLENEIWSVHFAMSGPSHYSMTMNTSLLVDWSFDTPILHKTDEPAFIFMSNGLAIPVGMHQDNEYYASFINDEAPVRTEMVFWLKISTEHMVQNRENAFVFTICGHHVNGEYSQNRKRQIPLLKTIISKMPDWVDPIWFISEFSQIKLVI